MAILEIDWKPTNQMLRTFGLLGLVIFSLLAAIAWWKHRIAFFTLPDTAIEPTIYTLLGLAAYCGLFAAVFPKALYPLYVTLTVVFYPIGFLLSYVIMFVLYYFVVAPIGLVFKLTGKDPMNRRFDPQTSSYWIRRRPPEDIKRYFRQF